MGLTIHYSLRSKVRSPKKARELVARLRGRALDLPFEEVGEIVELTGPACDFENCDREDPHRCHILETKGESYRLREAKRRKNPR